MKADENGFVHCYECPLVIDEYNLMCKANSHYDRHIKKWTMDDTDLNIGHQIAEFVKEHSLNENIPEMKVAFVGDPSGSSKP